MTFCTTWNLWDVWARLYSHLRNVALQMSLSVKKFLQTEKLSTNTAAWTVYILCLHFVYTLMNAWAKAKTRWGLEVPHKGLAVPHTCATPYIQALFAYAYYRLNSRIIYTCYRRHISTVSQMRESIRCCHHYRIQSRWTNTYQSPKSTKAAWPNRGCE